MPSLLLKDPKALVILAPSPDVRRLPAPSLPEIAVCGRSNVGKSSIINRLLGVRKAAHVSATPGKTRLIHIYEIPGVLRLVDLPGYGYAKVSKEERRKWDTTISGYLGEREPLRAAVALVDSRHEVSELDTGLLRFCEEIELTVQPVLTKADALKPSRKRHDIRERAAELGVDPGEIIATSSETGEGIDELARRILELAGAPARREAAR